MIEHFLEHYGAYAYFVILFLSSLGLPLPGESGLILGSLLAAAGKIDLTTFLILSFLGTVLGDCVGYAIGRYGGRKLLLKYGRYVKLTPKKLEKFEENLNKRGFYFVVSARFIVVLRQLNGIIAGAGGMKFLIFFIANIIGAVAWITVWGYGPYLIKFFF
ncbi:DedA family protein [Bartonella tamiae]|uniref:VTT domain-containing protein n=1 Tax=Bartonella tamiae Th239 TaxID=1094558 RepID=J0ZPL3_9HYPH|nr:DedA family protein [Bartonella tamiae]EJF90523.1 hypothetical protein ME5_00924 [Bartonella tamiae Th239]EJF93533.1 hypothetical protein MEG_00957 [Bartonella tamiae Th307]